MPPLLPFRAFCDVVRSLRVRALSSQKRGRFSCCLLANSLLIDRLILPADVFLFLSPRRVLTNLNPHLQIRRFHVKSGFHITIQNIRRPDPLGHVAGADTFYAGHTPTVLLHDPQCPHSVYMHAHPIHFFYLGLTLVMLSCHSGPVRPPCSCDSSSTSEAPWFSLLSW